MKINYQHLSEIISKSNRWRSAPSHPIKNNKYSKYWQQNQRQKNRIVVCVYLYMCLQVFLFICVLLCMCACVDVFFVTICVSEYTSVCVWNSIFFLSIHNIWFYRSFRIWKKVNINQMFLACCLPISLFVHPSICPAVATLRITLVKQILMNFYIY